MPPVLLFCRVTGNNTLSHSTLNSDELLRPILNVNPQIVKFKEFVSFLVTLFHFDILSVSLIYLISCLVIEHLVLMSF